MGQFTHEGVTYEELPDGNVRVVGYAAPDAGLAVVAPSAARVAERGLDATYKQGQIADQGRDAVMDAGRIETLPYDARKAEADAKKAEADAAKAQREAEKLQSPQRMARARSELYRMVDKIDKIAADAADNGGWFETGYTGSLLRERPGSAAFDLGKATSTLDANAAFSALQEMRENSPTGGALGGIAVKELDLLKSTISNLDPNQSQEQFLDNLGEARRVYSEMIDRLPPEPKGIDTRRPTVTGVAERPRMQLSRDGTRTEVDPTLRAFSGKLGRMIASGASDQRVKAEMRRAGVNPSDTSINEALAFRRRPEWQEWKRQNPNRPYPIGPSFYSREVSMTPGRAMTSAAAQSAPGAYAIEAANAITGGNLSRIAGATGGDEGMVDLGMSLVRTESPTASFLGDMTGSGLVTAAGGGLLSRAPGALSRLGGAAATDAMYGTVRGASEAEPGDALTGALSGGAANLAGGMFGRGASRLAGRALRGGQDQGLRLLNDAGVPLTIGQIAGRGGQAGIGGRVVKGLEDKAESLPVVGDMIRARRLEGVEGFNRAAFEEAGRPIQSVTDDIGEVGIGQLQRDTSGAYTRALGGVNAAPDGQFYRDIRPPYLEGRDLPGQVGTDFRYTFGKAMGQLDEAGLTGPRYQAVRQTLRRDRKAYEGAVNGHEFGEATRGIENAFEGLVRRQAPDAVPALDAADRTFRYGQVLRNAVGAAKNAEAGGVFTPAQLNTAAEQSGRRFGNTNGTVARPFFELGRAGQSVLPSRVPNSGTTDRALAGMALLSLAGGGAGVGAATANDGQEAQGAVAGGGMTLTGLGTLAALAAVPYSRTGRNAIQRGMFGNRGRRTNRAGEVAFNLLPYLTGPVGSSTARDLATLDEYEGY